MIKRKISVIILLIIFVVFSLLIFTYSYFKEKKSQGLAPSANQPAASQNLPNPEELQNDIRNYNQAQTTQNADLCGLINDAQAKDFCVFEVALNTKNTSVCLKINGESAKNDCVSSVLSKMAVASSNLLDCQKIKQSMLAKNCIEQIAASDATVDCKVISDASLANSCLSLVYYQQAKNKNDVKICSLIPELIRRANCLSEIGKTDLHSDTDRDGLDFLQEIIAGTDPNKKDTDGDGHSDGEEVKSGFNPDGAGLASEIKPITSLSCHDISDKGIQSLCLLELKDQPLDYSKCETIKNAPLQKYCFDLSTRSKK